MCVNRKRKVKKKESEEVKKRENSTASTSEKKKTKLKKEKTSLFFKFAFASSLLPDQWRPPRPSPAWRRSETLACLRSRSLSRCGGSRGEGRQGKTKCATRPASAAAAFQSLVFFSSSSQPLLSSSLFLHTPQNRDDPRAFYALLIDRTEELLPFVYTPTVGEVREREEGEGTRERGREKRNEDSRTPRVS